MSFCRQKHLLVICFPFSLALVGSPSSLSLLSSVSLSIPCILCLRDWRWHQRSSAPCIGTERPWLILRPHCVQSFFFLFPRCRRQRESYMMTLLCVSRKGPVILKTLAFYYPTRGRYSFPLE